MTKVYVPANNTSIDMNSRDALSVGAALGGQEIAGEQQHLLDLIDKLQFAQLDTSKLPRIVVVGDQSAGKSSVLEAITGTPFPRSAGACTRFATEIRLRRSRDEQFAVYIRPDKNRSLQEKDRLKQWGSKVTEETSFETLMAQAVELIAPKNIPGRFAAKDVLVVEKSGPNLPLLNVVDLPGLVKNANNDQSVEDIRAIEELTDTYMKSSRTIILAVVGGNQDYVQAPVLNKARQFDPKGSRTLGVLTKPDLTDTIGLEDKFIALVNNQDAHNNFKLGWYVVLNPGPRDEGQGIWSPEERAKKEAEFFSKGRWATLPPSMTGVGILKQRLSLQLSRHIAKYIPVLRKEITQELTRTTTELKSLGAGKDTVEEMKTELVKLASESNSLVTPAVDGTYKNPRGKLFFPKDVASQGIPAQKLRARTVHENKRFAAIVRDQGHKLTLTSATDQYSSSKKRVMSKEEFARKVVEPFLIENQGTQFSSDHDPRLVYALFQYYSANWPSLAREHKDNIGVICNEFIAEIIDSTWPRHMRENLRAEFLDPQMSVIMGAAQKEVELLEQDQNFEVQPYDAEYEVRLAQWRSLATLEKPHTVAEELLEKMLIYYELSARTFTSNVITQIVERHLLQGLYDIFSPVKIDSLTHTKVEAIAAESLEIRERRITLRQRKKAIEESLEACANLAMRKELRAHMDDDVDGVDDVSEDEHAGASVARRKVAAAASAGPIAATKPQTSSSTSRQSTQPALPNGYADYEDPRLSKYTPKDSARQSLPARPAVEEPTYNAPPPPPRPEKVPTYQQEAYYNNYNPPSPPPHTNDRPGYEGQDQSNSRYSYNPPPQDTPRKKEGERRKFAAFSGLRG